MELEKVEAKLATLREEKASLEADINEMNDQIKQLNEAVLSKIDYINVYNGGIEALQQLLNESNELDSDSRGESEVEAQDAADCADEAPAPSDS